MEGKVEDKLVRASSITSGENEINIQVTNGVQNSKVNVEEGKIKITAGTIDASMIYANPIKIEDILKMRNDLDVLTSRVTQLETEIPTKAASVFYHL